MLDSTKTRVAKVPSLRDVGYRCTCTEPHQHPSFPLSCAPTTPAGSWCPNTCGTGYHREDVDSPRGQVTTCSFTPSPAMPKHHQARGGTVRVTEGPAGWLEALVPWHCPLPTRRVSMLPFQPQVRSSACTAPRSCLPSPSCGPLPAPTVASQSCIDHALCSGMARPFSSFSSLSHSLNALCLLWRRRAGRAPLPPAFGDPPPADGAEAVNVHQTKAL